LRSLSLALLVIVGCSSERPSSALDRVKRSGVLRWGGDIQGGEPYVFEDPKRPDGLTGFEVEIAEALARELGVKAKFVQNDWSTLVPSLERGTFDLALNGLEVTAAREQRIRFTRPYYLFAERLVARAGDGRIRDLASLRGLRVGTLANSLAWDLLGASGAERVPYEGQEEPFLDLAQGRTDAVLLDDIIVARYGNKPGLAVVGDVAEGRYGIGVRRGEDDLWAAVDGALGRLARSGRCGRSSGAGRSTAPAGAAGGAGWGRGPSCRAAAAARRAPARPVPARGGGDGADLGQRHAAGHPGRPVPGGGAAALTGGLAPAAALGGHRLRRDLPGHARAAAALRHLLRAGGGLPLGAYAAAILGLGLNYAAYEAEIYRAGIQAVPRGEIEAAHALGMTGALTLRRVILPQAFRFSLPGVANDFIALLKDSSLVSVITVVELTKRMTIAAVDLGDWAAPGALCALLYFAMSYPLSRLARRLEAHLGGPR
jgi:polar amino acid transport system substrate-binding protein